ncbi:hypothetical protein BV898_08291 [Hypsibius exemplaris]|uniref:F-box domain-containing protein n=1 Tax=Hypsibius exemplaris TaxID=2072580 RepID=A0A1W0WR52_HYPEX|nr:hypothetical protein BV898_08291 [Hypsibius exemplaris]
MTSTPPPGKRRCLRSWTEETEVRQEPALQEDCQAIKDLPRETLSEVFTHLDLPTRIRLRKVCRFWKHVLLLPETNFIVLVDKHCFVLHSTLGWTWKRMQRPHKIAYTNVEVPHLRGFLGGHVRHIVYDGNNLVQSLNNTYNEYSFCLPWHIAWIVRWAPNATGLHLKRMAFQIMHSEYRYCNWASGLLNIMYRGFEPKGFNTNALQQPQLGSSRPAYPHQWTSLTVTASSYNKDVFASIRAVSDPLLWPYPADQLDWLDLNARRLPKTFEDCREPLYSLVKHTLRWNGPFDETVWHLPTLNYRELHGDDLMRVARCLLDYTDYYGNSVFPAPPHHIPRQPYAN